MTVPFIQRTKYLAFTDFRGRDPRLDPIAAVR